MRGEVVGGVERETLFTPLGEAILSCRSCNKELLYVLECEGNPTNKDVYGTCPFCQSKTWISHVENGLKLSCADSVVIGDYDVTDKELKVILLKR